MLNAKPESDRKVVLNAKGEIWSTQRKGSPSASDDRQRSTRGRGTLENKMGDGYGLV